MQSGTPSPAAKTAPLAIENLDKLQERYGSLGLARRAGMVLSDTAPAMLAAEDILSKLSHNKNLKQALVNIRKNLILAGKMRPSEARNLLMDPNCDFIQDTKRKLAAWRKTMQRVSDGESIVSEKGREYIPGHEPLALAIIGSNGISNYLSVVQLVVNELMKIEHKSTSGYAATIAGIRRCATVLSDCESASCIFGSVN